MIRLHMYIGIHHSNNTDEMDRWIDGMSFEASFVFYTIISSHKKLPQKSIVGWK